MNYKIKLNNAYKAYTLDQDKVIDPEKTVCRFMDKLKNINLDIFDGTVRVDNGRLGIPVYFSRCGTDATAVTGTKKQMGKGGTPQQAQASAVMELVERFSFFSFSNNKDNFFTDRHENIRDQAMDFEMIVRSVHDEVDDPEVTRSIFEKVPMRWTWGYNLSTDRTMFIPFDWFFMINEFNGPCAGNCPEEAIIQGICEVVERHVSSIVSRNRIRVPSIRKSSIFEPLVVEMLEKYHRTGIDLYLSDFSLDMGIPTVGVLAWDPYTFPGQSEIVWTAGTTPDPEKALSRALTETAQLAGDFNTGTCYVASGLPKLSHPEEADFIIHADHHVNISDLPNLSDNNIKTEILNCVQALAIKHMEIILIDTMHPGLQIPAFYTIIPGAHFRERALGTSVGMFCAKMTAEKNTPENAIKALSEMDQKLPGKYYIQFYMGTCHLQSHRFQEALDCFENALSLEPNQEDAAGIYSYMGVCLKEMQRYADALKMLEKGESLDHQRTDIHNLMGFCYFKLKKHQQAIECFQKVLALDPSSAIDYANIASNYRDMGNIEKAIEFYEKALVIDPGIDFARDNLNKLQCQNIHVMNTDRK